MQWTLFFTLFADSNLTAVFNFNIVTKNGL
jgi:hypothetical protein